ncbi:MAG: SEC-C domain-containing protein [Candidatus Omnitrophica bacterium]|nr:SEC-C domain-containing protein [Candidatus Omnitrophota bacterium]
MAKTQRNDPCPCGSGKKYKKCCMTGVAAQKKLFLGGISVRNRYIYASLIIIFALSVFLRCYGYTQSHSLTFDESLYAELLASQLNEDPTNYSSQAAYQSLMAQGQRPPLPKYLDRPLFKHPPLYCYLIALNYKFFGVNNLS